MKFYDLKDLWLRGKKKFSDRKAIGTVEIILILVVLIGLVLIFKDEIVSLVESIFGQIDKSVMGIY